jgi:hypothetical protein
MASGHLIDGWGLGWNPAEIIGPILVASGVGDCLVSHLDAAFSAWLHRRSAAGRAEIFSFERKRTKTL